MNTKTRILMTLLTTSLTFGLFPLAQPTSAQSARSVFLRRGNSAQSTEQSASRECRALKGRGVQVFDPLTGVVTGPVTNAGILNGTLEDVINFAAGFVFTPDPNVVAYTTDLTITTIHGQLKASPVTTQSIVTGSGAEWGSINPTASTGRFAGATGMIFITFKPVGDPSIGPYEAEITGEICLAN
ncbi:MAG TPA: hypothetical protein VFF31_17370 [Blastocatellia bacterium]|nr:hypothetical protein [Blastocatellia bacterium]